MSWAKVDDQWFAHPKVVGLSLAARGLWITTLSWSCAQRTDHLPAYMVRFLAGGEDIDPMVKELVDVGLWIEDGEGWAIHDWNEYQNLSLSEKRAKAGKKGAEKRWGQKQDANPPENGKSKQTDSKEDLSDVANAMAGARPDPSRPVPTRPNPQPPAEEDRQEKSEVGTAVDVIRHELPDEATTDRKTLENAVRPLIERGWPPAQLAQRLLNMKPLDDVRSYDAVLRKRCQELAEERSPAEVRADANRDYDRTQQMLQKWKADEDKAWGDLEGAV